MKTIRYKPIGVIRTPFRSLTGMPIQSVAAANIRGTIVLNSRLEAGLKDLDGFSHLIVIYHFHRARRSALQVVPFLDDSPRGVFATRAPKRPNAIGLSVVKLVRIEGTKLIVEGVDMLDGTPLLDIKPYVPAFDVRRDVRTGWLEYAAARMKGKRSDARFA